jgi:hypothetical protein
MRHHASDPKTCCQSNPGGELSFLIFLLLLRPGSSDPALPIARSVCAAASRRFEWGGPRAEALLGCPRHPPPFAPEIKSA